MNERAHPHRIAFLLLATVLPGLAAGVGASLAGGVQAGLLAGALASVLGFVVAPTPKRHPIRGRRLVQACSRVNR